MSFSFCFLIGKHAEGLKRRSTAGSKDDVSSLSNSKKDLSRPMARKDVLYTGSITNLPEYQSQKSLGDYRQSIVSLPKASQPDEEESCACCPCIPAATRKTMANLMDFSLMKDPVFLFIGVSNIFGMLGFYVPFVYIIDAATTRVNNQNDQKIGRTKNSKFFLFWQGIHEESAAFLLSIIGITNTVGRVVSGYISDFPAVDSLFVTNICITVSGLAVFCVPWCFDYVSFCIASGIFGLFSCKYHPSVRFQSTIF